MAFRRSGRSRSFRGSKRRTTWEQIPFQFTMPTAANTTVLDISNDNIIDDEASGGTCKRMIGSVTFEHALQAAAVEVMEMAVGIAVVTKDGLAAGAVPDPLSTVDQNQDWYFWRSFNSNVGIAGSDGGRVVFPIDIHTSRRLRGGYRLALVTEKAITELGIDVNISLRMLWSLDG